MVAGLDPQGGQFRGKIQAGLIQIPEAGRDEPAGGFLAREGRLVAILLGRPLVNRSQSGRENSGRWHDKDKKTFPGVRAKNKISGASACASPGALLLCFPMKLFTTLFASLCIASLGLVGCVSNDPNPGCPNAAATKKCCGTGTGACCVKKSAASCPQ